MKGSSIRKECFDTIDYECDGFDEYFMHSMYKKSPCGDLITLYSSIRQLGIMIIPHMSYKIKDEDKEFIYGHFLEDSEYYDEIKKNGKLNLYYEHIYVQPFTVYSLVDSSKEKDGTLEEKIDNILENIKESCNIFMKEFICRNNEVYKDIDVLIDTVVEFLPPDYIMRHDRSKSREYLKMIYPKQYEQFLVELEEFKLRDENNNSELTDPLAELILPALYNRFVKKGE